MPKGFSSSLTCVSAKLENKKEEEEEEPDGSNIVKTFLKMS